LKLDQLLEEAHIEHRYIGKETKLTNSEEFRRFHAFLKLIVNPYDNFAFLLAKDILGISTEEYSEIRQKAAAEGESQLEIAKELVPGEVLEYMLHIVPLGDDLVDVTDALCFAFGMPFDVTPIMEFIGKYASDKKEPTIQGYLDWLATIDIQDEVKEDYEGLTLMTIHAAKGLEWETVIVAGCNEEIIPSKQAIREGNVEEERRLMYVAMTRARDTLILTVRPEAKELNGRVYENPVSRFIGEIA
jgi:DNA helicase-2/ATP-dependent DNA helicase PcrA